MYLLIENQGIAPVECFTMLGLSTSRGEEDKIGQFGSGAKQAVLLMLRQGINPIIFIGEERLFFYSKPKFINQTQYNEVWYEYQGEYHKLSYCTEFGVLDWDHLDMALREFISNAIDSSNEYRVTDFHQEPEALANHTRIFIPWSTEVQNYFNQLSEKFLHFVKREKQILLLKKDKSPPRIYRKGVFVRQLEGDLPSIFDYNFGEELKIDECRNMSDDTAIGHIANLVSTDEVCVRTVFKRFVDGVTFWEQNLPYHKLHGDYDTFQRCWRDIAGEAVISCDSAYNSHALAKGLKVITLPVTSPWYSEMVGKGILTVMNSMHILEQKNMTLLPARGNTVEAVREMHLLCKELNLSHSKEMPGVVSFSKNMDAGKVIMGYYENDTVYINIANPIDKVTILEELAHYYTGSDDGSRDLQDFGFNFGVRMMERSNGN